MNWPSVRRGVRRVPETLLVLLALAVIPLLPRSWIVALARAAGAAAFTLARGLRRIALTNLTAAYGNKLSDSERRSIARQSFQTAALVLLDVFWFSFRCRQRVARYVEEDPSCRAYYETAPLVAITAHLGNWEMAGLASALRGSPMLSVAAPVKSPAAEFLMNHVRRVTGQRIVPRQGALRALLKELKNGGRVGLLLDQNVRPDAGGVFVPFFGLPVPVSDVAAVLCARTGAALMVAVSLPDGRGRYRLVARPPVRVGADGVPQAAATAHITRITEELIREQPGLWLWMYKRWRIIPPGEDAARYPFYAEASHA